MTWATSTRKSRLPANWRYLRAIVLKRDGVCQIRWDDDCETIPTDVDHVLAGDDHRLSNLQAACGRCHDRKSAAEGHAAKPRRTREPEPHPGRV